MSLFSKLYKEAATKGELTKEASVTVKLYEAGEKPVTVKAAVTIDTLDESVAGVVAALASAEKASFSTDKTVFSASTAKHSFQSTGKFAAAKFAQHEGFKPEKKTKAEERVNQEPAVNGNGQ